MTNEEHRRLTAALVAKMRRGPWGGLSAIEAEELESVVGTTIADTVLVLEGIATIEQYEQALA